jgi:hypothetical protein
MTNIFACLAALPETHAGTSAATVATNPTSVQVSPVTVAATTSAAVPAGTTAVVTVQSPKSNKASSKGGSIGLGMCIIFGTIAIARFINSR